MATEAALLVTEQAAALAQVPVEALVGAEVPVDALVGAEAPVEASVKVRALGQAVAEVGLRVFELAEVAEGPVAGGPHRQRSNNTHI